MSEPMTIEIRILGAVGDVSSAHVVADMVRQCLDGHDIIDVIVEARSVWLDHPGPWVMSDRDASRLRESQRAAEAAWADHQAEAAACAKRAHDAERAGDQ